MLKWNKIIMKYLKSKSSNKHLCKPQTHEQSYTTPKKNIAQTYSIYNFVINTQNIYNFQSKIGKCKK